MNELLKKIWNEFDNFDFTTLIFASLFISTPFLSPFLLIFLGLPYYILLLYNSSISLFSLVWLASIIINHIILYYGTFPKMRGNFGKVGQILVEIFAIISAPAIFMAFIVYFLGIAPTFIGNKIQKLLGCIILFLFNPFITILLGVGVFLLNGLSIKAISYCFS